MNYRVLIIALGLLTPVFSVQALNLSESVTLTPSKIELIGNPGESLRREFTITSQSNEDLNISLRFEDLTEGDAPNYPLTPYLVTPERNFSLPAQGRVTVPIIVTLPEDISPGGFYGAVAFAITRARGEVDVARVVTRLTPLIFLRVNGEVSEVGSLLDFKFLDQTFYLTYENLGNIYLNPYGVIELANKFTGKKTERQVDPWFVLPGATRIREIRLEGSLPTGWYEAKVKLNRGYQDIIDENSINFIILTPKVLGLIILFFIILMIGWFRYRKIIFIFTLLPTFVFVGSSYAQVATSPNYRLQADSLNFSGNLSASTNYKLEDTLGELATGLSTSANYGMKAGYQQMLTSSISITAPSDVTLSGIAGNGTSNGSVAWTVTTDNSAGYTLSVRAGSNPALTSGGDNFSDYAPSGANPDYGWSVGASASAFGFSVEGTDTASRYLDNSTSCATGASNASDQCWDGFSTSNRTIAQSSAANTPSGVATTIKLRAEIGSSKTQAVGSYSTTLTITATPR